jgi:putative ABC transport system substrate-binding protein
LRQALERGLRESGWVQGQNVTIDYRFAEGRFDQLPTLAAELVQSKPDVIVATPTPAALAVKKATGTIPVVMVGVGDPVGVGLIASLARPGGNITGLTFGVGFESLTKALELFKQVVPGVQRVAVLSNAANPAHALSVGHLKAEAQPLRMQLQFLEVRGPNDFDNAFAAMAREHAAALFIVTDPLFILHRERLSGLAMKYRFPTMYGDRESVVAGGLMSYGPSLTDQFYRAATYVDRILKGTKPADLPVEQPTKFEFIINLKTARALGLTIPQLLLLRADEVIQ